MDLHQGDRIELRIELGSEPTPTSCTGARTYQVIGIDAGHDRCWLRRWPLARQGSPVFQISLAQVQSQGLHCPSWPQRPGC